MCKWKRFAVLLLALALVIGLNVGVFAGASYSTGYGNYVAEKISHPNQGVKEVDGIVDSNGVGDRGQTEATAAVGYGDYMYVGTSYASVSKVIQSVAFSHGWDPDIVNKTMDVLYNGTLFTNMPSDPDRSVLLKINTKTGAVIVLQSNRGAPYLDGIMFHDKLYFLSGGASPAIIEATPTEKDTKDTVRTVYWGDYRDGSAARGMAVVQNQLVVAFNSDSGAYIVASKSPSSGPGFFHVIANQDGQLMGYPAFQPTDAMGGAGIWDMAEFNGKLYVSVVTKKAGKTESGFALLEGTYKKSSDSWTFKTIVGDAAKGAVHPYGIGSPRAVAADLVSHNGNLYIGSCNDTATALSGIMDMKYEDIYKDLSSPVKLWKMNSSYGITEIGGFGDGLGSRLNQAVPGLESYNDRLYVATFDASSLLYPWMQFTNGEILERTPAEWLTQIRYIIILIEALVDQGGMALPFSEDLTNRIDAMDLSEAKTISAEKQDAMIAEFLANIDGMTAEEKEALAEKMMVLAENMYAMSGELDKKAEDPAILSVPTLETVPVALPAETGDPSQAEPSQGAGVKEETVKGMTQQDFLGVLTNIVEIYESISDLLPTQVTDILDQIINQENVDNLGYFLDTSEYLKDGERGFDFFLSNDGTSLNVLTRTGFGDPYNDSGESFAVTNRGISIGTGNPFYGAQIWNIEDLDNPVVDSIVPDTYFTYDKYVKGKLHKPIDIPITWNGNHIKEIQYQYLPLTEGKDYIVTETGVRLTQAFLDTLPVKEHRVRLTFNVGKWTDCYVNVIDTTPKDDQLIDPIGNIEDFFGGGGAGSGSGGTSTGDPSHEGVLLLVAILGLMGLATAGGMVAQKRWRGKSK